MSRRRVLKRCFLIKSVSDEEYLQKLKDIDEKQKAVEEKKREAQARRSGRGGSIKRGRRAVKTASKSTTVKKMQDDDKSDEDDDVTYTCVEQPLQVMAEEETSKSTTAKKTQDDYSSSEDDYVTLVKPLQEQEEEEVSVPITNQPLRKEKLGDHLLDSTTDEESDAAESVDKGACAQVLLHVFYVTGKTGRKLWTQTTKMMHSFWKMMMMMRVI